jgi:hypothetical protein
MKDYILKDFADKRIFNYLYSTEKGFVGYMDKLTKKERALIGAKLIWKRKENKYTADEFAIEFGEWLLSRATAEEGLKLRDDILEIFKKEKGYE